MVVGRHIGRKSKRPSRREVKIIQICPNERNKKGPRRWEAIGQKRRVPTIMIPPSRKEILGAKAVITHQGTVKSTLGESSYPSAAQGRSRGRTMAGHENQRRQKAGVATTIPSSTQRRSKGAYGDGSGSAGPHQRTGRNPRARSRLSIK